MRIVTLLALVSLLACATVANGQSTFGGNAQHTAIYQPAAQDLNRIRWSTPIDLNNTGANAHYGAPLITAANTVIAPVKTASGFQVNVFNGVSGAAMYTLMTDYILPSYTWVPVYQPVLATGPAGQRLYYAGAGGAIYYIDTPDSGASTPGRMTFYTQSLGASAYNSTVFVNTPITAAANGDIFFGFRVQGTAPAPLNTTQSGFARIHPTGATTYTATYVLAGSAAGDANITMDSHNSAPAISNDGLTVYVPVKSGSSGSKEYYGYLLGLDTTTLATKYKVFLKDPRNGNNAAILDISTASPTVAPDNDVYFGIYSNPDNGSRGFLLRFSGDLTVEKTPGGFGWDYTAAIVPSTMAPLYTGSSSYLIFSKYNNYYGAGDGNGVNRIALLDPNATQIDPHPSANGLVEMREVLTAIGPTPDSEHASVPNAVREWCIDTAAVNPATNSIFTPSEDGHIYRWNLATNSLTQAVTLSPGVGEPYVPTVIGPDGTVYTLNGGTMFALGGLTGVAVTNVSSVPDLRSAVAGQSLTFTAAVADTGATGFTPTGTITFQDTIYTASGSTTSVLGVPSLDSTGHASYTASAGTALLSAAQHFITAVYSGDSKFTAGSMTLVQNVHTYGSTTSVTSSPNPSSFGQTVTITAAVTTIPSGASVPTGMVTFQEGSNILAQKALDSGGTVSFTTSSLSAGPHTIAAIYASDSLSAASSGSVTQTVGTGAIATKTTVSSSPNPSVLGQTVTFTATVSAGTGTPAGTVTFKEGGTALSSAVPVDAAGHASFSTASLGIGSHTITASFIGASGWSNSSGNTATPQVVNKDATTTTVTSSKDPSVVGNMVTFTVTVTVNAPGVGAPTGTVTFRDKNTILGTASLASGSATLTTSTLTQGAHQITVSYSGDATDAASTSSTLVQNVSKK